MAGVAERVVDVWVRGGTTGANSCSCLRRMSRDRCLVAKRNDYFLEEATVDTAHNHIVNQALESMKDVVVGVVASPHMDPSYKDHGMQHLTYYHHHHDSCLSLTHHYHVHKKLDETDTQADMLLIVTNASHCVTMKTCSHVVHCVAQTCPDKVVCFDQQDKAGH